VKLSAAAKRVPATSHPVKHIISDELQASHARLNSPDSVGVSFHMVLGTRVRNSPSGRCYPRTRGESNARICDGKASPFVELNSGNTSRVSAECPPLSPCTPECWKIPFTSGVVNICTRIT
jgi:hypothetical protein